MDFKRKFRIPFSALVEWSVGPPGKVRNISETGVYIESPPTEPFASFKLQTQTQCKFTPFGSFPQAQIKGNIVRIDHLITEEGPQLGFGIEFVDLSSECRKEIKAQVDQYSKEVIQLLQNSLEDFQTGKESVDFIHLGTKLFEFSQTLELSEQTWARNICQFLSSKDQKAISQTIGALRAKGNLEDKILGQVHLAELSLQTIVDHALQSEATDVASLKLILKSVVRSLQDKLFQASEKIDLSKFQLKKEIAQSISRLSFTLDQEVLRLSGEKNFSHFETTHPHSSTPLNPFLDLFLPIDFYKEYAAQGGSLSLDTVSRAELVSLLADWEEGFSKGEGLSEEALKLFLDARAFFLKLSSERMQLVRKKPLAYHLVFIQPQVEPILKETKELEQSLRTLATSRSSGLSKDHQRLLEGVADKLFDLEAALSSFVRTLPENTKEAAIFYETSKAFKVKKISPFQTFKRKKAVQAIRPTLALGFFLVALVWGGFHWGSIKNLWLWTQGGGLGEDLAIQSFTTHHGTWIGKVSQSEWNQFSPKDRLQRGSFLLTKVLDRGFQELHIVTQEGKLVARSAFRDKKPEFFIIETPDPSEMILTTTPHQRSPKMRSKEEPQ